MNAGISPVEGPQSDEQAATVREAERDAPIEPCEHCNGRGRWRAKKDEYPRTQTRGGPWMAYCVHCHGTGLTTHGRRVGGRGWGPAGSGFSHCGRCVTPWAFVPNHTTEYAPGRGMFPLCEACWSELTPAERIPFYWVLFQSWIAEGATDVEWSAIEAAVLAEDSEPQRGPER